MIRQFSTLLLLALLASAASGATVYVAQTATGDGSGSSTSNRKAITTINSSWGLSAGDTLSLGGTFNNSLTIGGSGAAGNPIAVLFESGAKMSAPYWNPPAINIGSMSNIVINGGVNGLIIATANGSGLAYSNTCTGLTIDSGALNVTIQNLTISNMYVRTPGSGENSPGAFSPRADTACMIIRGCNINVISNTTCNAEVGINVGCWGGTIPQHDVTIFGNHLYGHCISIAVGSGNGGNPFYNFNIISNQFDHWGAWSAIAPGTGNIHLNGIYAFSNYGPPNTISNVVISHNWFGPDVYANANTVNTTACIHLSTDGDKLIAANGMDAVGNHAAINWKVFNNVFVNTNGNQNIAPWANGFISQYGFFGNSIIANNTVLSTNFNGSFVSTYASGYGVAVPQVINNFCLSIQRAENAAGYADFGGNTNINTTFHSDYNVFNMLTGSGCMVIPLWAITNISNGQVDWGNWNSTEMIYGIHLSNFCAGVVFDVHSSTKAPLINAFGQPLTNDTVLVNAGTNLTSWGIVNDFYGNPRPTTGPWTIGAFQMAGTASALQTVSPPSIISIGPGPATQ
jgi:hypothetical protein